MPVDLEQEVELAKHEREHVMQKLTKHGKVENVCPGTSCAALPQEAEDVVSEHA